MISRRDKKRFVRAFLKLRNAPVLDVANERRVVNVSYRTLVRVMNENRYEFLRQRQKGLLSGKDRKRRVHFAQNALKQCDPEFWANDVLLYLDGVSLIHKHNPYNNALKERDKFGEDPMKVYSTPQRDRRSYLRGGDCTFLLAFGTKQALSLRRRIESLTWNGSQNSSKKLYIYPDGLCCVKEQREANIPNGQ